MKRLLSIAEGQLRGITAVTPPVQEKKPAEPTKAQQLRPVMKPRHDRACVGLPAIDLETAEKSDAADRPRLGKETTEKDET